MPNSNNDKSIIIIGAGFAGLAAGIYAQMNGYKTQIFEMHDKPGGLCTSWRRKGYTIDACIHWLVGSSPKSNLHDFWEEVGIAQGREFINMDEYMHFESPDGRVLTFYTDVDRLEKSLLEFSPADREQIIEFIDGIRMCLSFDQPSKQTPVVKRLMKKTRLVFGLIKNGKKMQQWMKITSSDFASRFKNPLLRKALEEIWIPEFSMLFMFFTFAYLHTKNAGYPLGGSMPMSQAMEKRYTDLGGIINYNKRVDKIITENASIVINLLDQRFPGISSQVEMIDVATPMTFERYTGNWKGSFEGWLITPENANVVMKPMSQSLPGLSNFYMCGQWVEPGGGLPTGVMSGRRLIKALCKDDHRKFITK